ncbi:MAG: biotin/lipoyl-binding protein [Bacteroidales bacterium]|nr:biotin/lipoyl-binding protein [Bacteroidales bacterium]
MSLEIVSGKRKETIEILKQDGNKITLLLGKTNYELNVVRTSNYQYSIIYNGKSYDIAVVKEKDHKNYIVDTEAHSYKIEIIDAESKFQKMKQKTETEDEDNSIISPIPGKVVKIFVKTGQKVKTGDTIIVISAMKMDSEFKTKKNGVVKKINVKEGDTVEGGKKLVIIK